MCTVEGKTNENTTPFSVRSLVLYQAAQVCAQTLDVDIQRLLGMLLAFRRCVAGCAVVSQVLPYHLRSTLDRVVLIHSYGDTEPWQTVQFVRLSILHHIQVHVLMLSNYLSL